MRKAMLLLSAVFVLALLLVVGKLLISGDSFGLTNPSWDGISSVAMNDRTAPLDDFSLLRQAGPDDTLLIIGPSASYTGQDVADVSSFMLNGGRAIVMDDYGTADTLLESLGSPIEIRHVPLCQDVDFYRSPSLPLVNGIAYHGITDNVSILAFNHPVSLLLSGDARPLARTSSKGWLDADDNSTIDGNETFGSYTVMAQAGYGKGELIVAGDADLLVNGMLRKGDNGVLLGNIMKGGTVYVDTGHGLRVPPLASLYFLIKFNIFAQAVCVLAIMAAAGACIAWGGPRGKKDEQKKDRNDIRRSLIASMKAEMPLSERDIKVLNKKL
jgi:hypothetical protein